MSKKTVTVKCPWCKMGFEVEIDAKYKGAKAIPQGANLPKDEGEELRCPYCPRQFFIKWIK